MKKVIIVTGSNREKRAREIQNKVYRLELAEKCVVFDEDTLIDSVIENINKGNQVIVTVRKTYLVPLVSNFRDALIVDTDFNL